MRKIEVSEETYDKIKEQLKEEEKTDMNSLDDMVGKKFFFRTVTYYLVGRVTKIIGSIAQLEDASWVADSGRFTQAIKEGTLNEIEPVGECYLNTQTIVDFFPWKHDLPMDQK